MKRATQCQLLEIAPSFRPHQVEVPEGESDDWFTPMDLFEERHRWAHFTLDIAGHAESPVSQAIGKFFTIQDDAFLQDWSGHRIWCNPPFSEVPKWVAAVHHALLVAKVAPYAEMLLPSNRTEQPFWQQLVERQRDRLSGELRTVNHPRRRKFGFPGDPTGVTGYTPQFGLVSLVFQPR